MASACKSLRECERWRGEILREISRKVSKIQDGPCFFFLLHRSRLKTIPLSFVSLGGDSWSLGLRSAGCER